MKEEYVNPFLVPAKLVWEKELGHTLALEFTTRRPTVEGAIESNRPGMILSTSL